MKYWIRTLSSITITSVGKFNFENLLIKEIEIGLDIRRKSISFFRGHFHFLDSDKNDESIMIFSSFTFSSININFQLFAKYKFQFLKSSFTFLEKKNYN